MIIEFDDKNLEEIVDRLKNISEIINKYELETEQYCCFEPEQIELWNIINKLSVNFNEKKEMPSFEEVWYRLGQCE
jgi:DNA repair ATPase RecN